VDFDSTLLGGDIRLVEAIVSSPRLEAWMMEPADSLAADADKINGSGTGG
jgi:mevalonate kinase